MFCRLASVVVLSVWFCGVVPAAGSGGVWLDVPFIRQEKDGCGAASIAMVMQYWLKQQGRSANGSADAAQIQRALFAPGARGIYASAMERYFRQHGFRTFSFRGEWNDLEQHLQKERPLIVALKPSGSDVPLHYVVVAGVDSQAGLVLLNDPAQRKLLKQDRSGFEKKWSSTNKWTLLALPQPAER
ncbi:MAG: C39 family peptidase [Acidobacteria bacterium]|nr:C39 family peptidase [Acidobacteriota bacterium]